jgi:hypothetical protein
VLPEKAREVEDLVIAELLADEASLHAGGVRHGDRECHVTLRAGALGGDRRFHEALAEGASLADGSQLSSQAAATVAQRIARAKTRIAQGITSNDGDVFSADGQKFGRLLLAAVRGT